MKLTAPATLLAVTGPVLVFVASGQIVHRNGVQGQSATEGQERTVEPSQEPERTQQGIPVWLEHDGKTYTPDTLPDQVDRKSRTALEKWLGYLAKSEVPYTVEVLKSGRGVFIFAPEIVEKKRAKKPGPGSTRADRRRQLEKERRKREKEEAERLKREGPPRPPEEVRREHLKNVRTLFDQKLPAAKAQYPTSTQWGRDTKRYQREVPVLIMVRDRGDFNLVLDGVLASNQYLSQHVADAKGSKITGLILEHPLLGVVIQQPEESEEHRPHQELAKRQVELLLFKRFGPQPFFVREGVAWCFEWSEFGELRTFTGRTQFIGTGDPAYAGWRRSRRSLFREGGGFRFDTDLDVMSTLREWRSDRYQDDLAAASFQLARCLMDRHRNQAGEILGRWGSETAEGRGSWSANGGWTLDPNFVLKPQELVAGLQGVSILESVRAYER